MKENGKNIFKDERVIKHYNSVLRAIKTLPFKKYKLIDIGAADKLLKKFLPKNIEYYSLDYKGDHDFIFNLDSGRLPIKDKSFDIIICLETLEHLLYPDKIMEEFLRIGKKNAIFILSMPNEYNFILRFYYLIGKKTSVQETFKTTSKHLHIHSPRVKDIIIFLSNYIKIEAIDYYWQSRGSMTSNFIFSIDKLINKIAKYSPNLFSRIVVVRGRKKWE